MISESGFNRTYWLSQCLFLWFNLADMLSGSVLGKTKYSGGYITQNQYRYVLVQMDEYPN